MRVWEWLESGWRERKSALGMSGERLEEVEGVGVLCWHKEDGEGQLNASEGAEARP